MPRVTLKYFEIFPGSSFCCKTKSNLLQLLFAVRKFKIRLKMMYYLGKSTGSVCSVSDFRKTIFESFSGTSLEPTLNHLLKDLARTYIESKNVCKVKLLNILFM